MFESQYQKEFKELKLEPCTAERWLECPASALETVVRNTVKPSFETIEDGKLPEDGAQGLKMQKYLGQIASEINWNQTLNTDEVLSGLSAKEKKYFEIYLDEIRTIYLNAVNIKDMDFNKLVKLDDVFGADVSARIDFYLVDSDTLYIVDFYTDTKRKILAKDNTRLMLCAAGILVLNYRKKLKYRRILPVKKINFMIIQPTMKETSNSWELSVDDYLEWLEETKLKIKESRNSIIPVHNAGFHCLETNCPFRNDCKSYFYWNLRTMRSVVFENQLNLDTEKKISLYQKLAYSMKFMEEWKDKIESEVIGGEYEIPGYRVVDKKSNRKISDVKEARMIFMENGFSPEEYLKPDELKSVAQLEATLGKEVVDNLIGGLIVKPDKGKTLIKETEPTEKERKVQFKRKVSDNDTGVNE